MEVVEGLTKERNRRVEVQKHPKGSWQEAYLFVMLVCKLHVILKRCLLVCRLVIACSYWHVIKILCMSVDKTLDRSLVIKFKKLIAYS